MCSGRLVWFLISIALGVAAGLAYGWMFNPVQYVNTTPDTLRDDYKADYALMVAEIYEREGNVDLAAKRLQLLADDAPLRIVQRAIITAQELDYSSRDLERLGRLSMELQNWSPGLEEAQP